MEQTDLHTAPARSSMPPVCLLVRLPSLDVGASPARMRTRKARTHIAPSTRARTPFERANAPPVPLHLCGSRHPLRTARERLYAEGRGTRSRSPLRVRPENAGHTTHWQRAWRPSLCQCCCGCARMEERIAAVRVCTLVPAYSERGMPTSGGR